jgi:4-hydroxy-tetrahydrodipicolinate synthase
VESLKAGAAGLSCIQGNYFPELISWICKNFDQSSKAAELSFVRKFLEKNMALMHAVYPKVAKYFLRKRGLSIDTFTRTFTGVFDDDSRQRIDALAKEYQAIHEMIGSKYAI